MPAREEQQPSRQQLNLLSLQKVFGNSLLHGELGSQHGVSAALGPLLPALLPLEKLTIPSSTTKVGIAPLPCSIDTTLSWEQFLQGTGEPGSELPGWLPAWAAPQAAACKRAAAKWSLQLPLNLQKASSCCSEPGSVGPRCDSTGLSLFVWLYLCCSEKSLPEGERESCPVSGLSAVPAAWNNCRACLRSCYGK